MRVFFNTIVIQIVINLYIFIRGWHALPDKKIIKVPFTLIFGVEILSYFAGYFFSKSLPYHTLHDIAWLATSWAVFAGYMAVLVLLYDLVRFIDKRKKFLPSSIDLTQKKYKGIYYISALILVVGSMSYGSYRFYNPVVVEKTLLIEKQSPNVNELRIAVVSDIHAGFLIDKKILGMYVDRIIELKPDMILLVGDIIDYDIASVKRQNMHEELHRLKAPYGAYAVTGNHEYINVDSTEFAKIDWLRDESGLTLLQDTAILIDNSFYLVGREDDKCKTRKELSEIVKDVDKSLPMIVMNHEPHRLNEEVENGADIALYGHTHDGQIFPANILVSMLYEVSHGYKKIDNTHVYVSSGLGLAGPQYRIGTISEIVLLNVKFNN